MTVRPWMVVTTVAAATLAFGAVYPWAYWPLAVVIAGIGLIGSGSAGLARTWRGALATSLIVVAAAIALQMLPWPRHAFTMLSPSADRFLRAYDFGYANNPPAWHPLSIAPGETAIALALFAALSILLVGLAAAFGRMHLAQLLGGLTAVGVAIALLAIVQRALTPADSTLVYGFWKPIWGGNPFGPFINRNHFAGWMVMMLPLTMSFAVATIEGARQPVRPGAWEWIRWLATADASRVALIGFSVVVMGTALVVSGSRSGIASAGVACVALTWFVSNRLNRPGLRALAIGVFIVAAAGAMLWGGFDATLARFSMASRDLPGRLGAWRDTIRIIRDFPLAGTGLGTYMNAMLVYQTGDRQLIFFQAHNDYLQLAAEGGALVVLPALVAIVTLGRAIARRFSDAGDPPFAAWVRRGAAAGLIGIAAQSAVEFSLQLPANTLLFVVLAAIAVHPEPRARRV